MTVRPAGGSVAPGYEAVAAAFAEDLGERGDAGAAFAAVVDGELVVDLWGGVADDRAGAPWRSDTAAVLFSGTKGIVACALLLLVDRGVLQLDAPVAEIWPEFGVAGKEGVTVADLAAHTAGLPAVTTRLARVDLADPVRIAALLAGQAPLLVPGRPCYHALTFGWLVGEIVRRADGRSIGRFVRAELAASLGDLDLWIGLPAGGPVERRVARLRPAADYRLGAFLRPDVDPRLRLVYENPPLGPEAWNDPALLRLELAAAGGVGTARALAALYGALVRTAAPLVRRDTLTRGNAAIGVGDDPLSGRPLRFSGVGFELAGTPSELGPPTDAFGHTGAGGSSHGAWPDLRTGFSYVTVDLRREDVDGRAASLLAALHASVSGQGRS